MLALGRWTFLKEHVVYTIRNLYVTNSFHFLIDGSHCAYGDRKFVLIDPEDSRRRQIHILCIPKSICKCEHAGPTAGRDFQINRNTYRMVLEHPPNRLERENSRLKQ